MIRLLFLVSISLSVSAQMAACGHDVSQSTGVSTQRVDTVAQVNAGRLTRISKGGEMLLHSRDAYAALPSYTGTITSEHTSNYARGPHKGIRKLNVSFQKPGTIQLNGLDSNGEPYVIVSDGNTTTVSAMWLRTEGSRATIKDALKEFSGISLGGTLMLPGILLETKWARENPLLPDGDFLKAFSTNANLDGTELIDGHKCYRIVCPRSIVTWTIFVDEGNLLIRRLDEDVSESQMRARHDGGGGGRSGLIVSTHETQTWTWNEETGKQRP